ncbi:MAG: hypothetical protein EXQ87_06240 [Alphaproteobacteria bacterium]|nr:hypothetical protein [Alphaproteobacteria bacterium]
MRRAAEAKGIALIRTPMGFAFAPMRDREVMTPDVFQKLDEAEQEEIRRQTRELEAMLQETLVQFPRWEREHRDKARALTEEVTRQAVGHPITELRRIFSDIDAVRGYLDAVEADVVANVEPFLRAGGGGACHKSSARGDGSGRVCAREHGRWRYPGNRRR